MPNWQLRAQSFPLWSLPLLVSACWHGYNTSGCDAVFLHPPPNFGKSKSRAFLVFGWTHQVLIKKKSEYSRTRYLENKQRKVRRFNTKHIQILVLYNEISRQLTRAITESQRMILSITVIENCQPGPVILSRLCITNILVILLPCDMSTERMGYNSYRLFQVKKAMSS